MAVKSIANVVGFITEGLDAVVLSQEVSTIYPGCVKLHIAGNDRDLGIATERAMTLGGVVD